MVSVHKIPPQAKSYPKGCTRVVGGHKIGMVKRESFQGQRIQVLDPEKALETFDAEMNKGIDIGPVTDGVCILYKILAKKGWIIIGFVTGIIPDLYTGW